MRDVFKNFKPVWKFHTSLKNLNQFKKIQTKEKIWTTTYTLASLFLFEVIVIL